MTNNMAKHTTIREPKQILGNVPVTYIRVSCSIPSYQLGLAIATYPKLHDQGQIESPLVSSSTFALELPF